MSRRKKYPSLVVQFQKFFNKYRDAHIALIADNQPSEGIVVVYENGSEILLDDVMTYVGLFDKLNALHPRE